MSPAEALAQAREDAQRDGQVRYLFVDTGDGWAPPVLRVVLSEPNGDHVRVEASGAVVVVAVPAAIAE